jgi:hypothetical protein
MNAEEVARGLGEYACALLPEEAEAALLSSALAHPVHRAAGGEPAVPLSALLPPSSTTILVLGRNLL